MTLKKTVVLVGMMGSGKSAIGKSLSQHLNVPFLDSDAEIVAAANLSISEIFERDGEAFFRSVETRVLERLLKGDPCVLSTGGGAFMSQENRDLISKLGVSVLLDADLDLLWDRVRHKDTRPLLQTDDPYKTLSEIFDERRDKYLQANLRVKTLASYSIAETTQVVADALAAHEDILVT